MVRIDIGKLQLRSDNAGNCGWQVGKPYTTTMDKKGRKVPVVILQDAKYFPELSQAIEYMCKYLVQDGDTITSLKDYLEQLKSVWNEVARLTDLKIDRAVGRYPKNKTHNDLSQRPGKLHIT